MQIEEPDVLSLERRFFNGLFAYVEAVDDLMSDVSLYQVASPGRGKLHPFHRRQVSR